MPAYDGTARIGLTLDQHGFGLLTLNGVPIPAVSLTLEVTPGERPYIAVHISPEEVRAALEAADLRLVVDEPAVEQTETEEQPKEQPEDFDRK